MSRVLKCFTPNHCVTYPFLSHKTTAPSHVLLDEVEASIHGDEGSDLLAVLDQLDTSALTNGRVGLLCLNATASTSHVVSMDMFVVDPMLPKSHIFSSTMPFA